MMMGSYVGPYSFDPRFAGQTVPAYSYHTPNPHMMQQVPPYQAGQDMSGSGYQGYYGQGEQGNTPYAGAHQYGSPADSYYTPFGSMMGEQSFQGMNPYYSQMNGIQMNQQMPMNPGYVNPFENPLQQGSAYGPKVSGQAPANPYPAQNTIVKQQSQSFSSILNQFKTQDGSFDINKMMSTAGQMMNTMNQVSSIVKGFGGFFKTTV
ncbi:YppG family protein [Peribacillus kribbensis]|uniref:YppG family protein n=1 Tax=Peribacillus kribbensis TaxID=356658 RepID=UPI000413C2B1|nr:YppG family protein [Peribacillus kribbensis]